MIEVDVRAALALEKSSQLRAVPVSQVSPGAPVTHPGIFYSLERACPKCGRSLPELDPRLFSYNSEAGACPTSGSSSIRKAVKKGEAMATEFARTEDEPEVVCPDCGGARLNEVARNVRWVGKAIQEVCRMTAREAAGWFRGLKLNSRSAAIAHDALEEIRSRLSFLAEVGLDYLTLERSAPTLSGGEQIGLTAAQIAEFIFSP